MRNKSYKYNLEYIRRNCWVDFHIKREKAKRKAARMIGYISYIQYFTKREHMKISELLLKHSKGEVFND